MKHLPAKRLVCALAVLASLAACEPEDGAEPIDHDGGHDGGAADGSTTLPERDGGEDAAVVDAGRDAAEPDAGAEDAGRDTGTSEPDAEVVCDCVPNACESAECIAGRCERTWLASGTECGELGTQVCVRGECLLRGCGDGYREPGPSPEREACDDGPQDGPGDGCSDECTVEPLVVNPDDDTALATYPTEQASAVAVDGLGRTLWVFSRESSDGTSVKFKLGNSPEAEVEELVAAQAVQPEPDVLGLPGGGFIVTWTATNGADRDVFARFVAGDGELGQPLPVSVAAEGEQSGARLILSAGSPRVVFLDRALGVRARSLSSLGLPQGDEIVVDATTPARKSAVRAAAIPGTDQWLVTWIERGATVSDPWLLEGRRYASSSAVDEMPLQIALDALSVSATALASEFVVAYGTGHEDALGNVYAQRVPVMGALEQSAEPLATSVAREALPSVSALDAERFVVGYWEGQPAVLRIVASAGELPSEVATLRTRVEAGAESHLSLSGSSDGVWFAWSGTDSGSARPKMSLFFLPGS